MNLPVPTCADCGAPRFSKKPKKSPYCRKCSGRHIGRDPRRRARASASMRAYLADPVHRAEHVQRTTEGVRRAVREDPEFAARKREEGRRMGLRKQGMAAYPAGSDLRITNGRKSSATKLAWCPPEYRAEYRRLVKKKGIPAVEARAIILAAVEADAARYRATGVLPQAARNAERRP